MTEKKKRRSAPRQSRNFTKLIKKLEERADSKTETIAKEALKNLQALLIHIDEQKNKAEERRIRRELAKLRAGMGLDPEPAAQHVNNTAPQEQDPVDRMAAQDPEVAKALAEYRAIVSKEK